MEAVLNSVELGQFLVFVVNVAVQIIGLVLLWQALVLAKSVINGDYFNRQEYSEDGFDSDDYGPGRYYGPDGDGPYQRPDDWKD